MGKLTINYDLMKKVKESKWGFNPKVIRDNLIYINLGAITGISISTFSDGIPNFFGDAKKTATYVILNGMMILGINLVATEAFYDLNKKNVKKEANEELSSLNSLLMLNNILDWPISQKSKKIKTHYEITYTDGDKKLPRLNQYKDIEIPMYGGSKKVLYQKHEIGSKVYELSNSVD